MDFWKIISHPFTLGLGLGLLFFVMSAWSHFRTARDFRRYRKHLSDKLDLDAGQIEGLKKECETIRRENENLRVRVGMMSEKPDQKILRDLEVLTRAEKRMVLRAPGFAPAWEAAKSEASDEIAQEEIGKSLPRRLFNKLFGNAALKYLDAGQTPATAAETPAAEAGTTGAESRS